MYRNTKAMVKSDTEVFDTMTGVLHGDIPAPYLFIILRSFDTNNSFDLTVNKRSSRHPAKLLTYVDYADVLDHLADITSNEISLLEPKI